VLLLRLGMIAVVLRHDDVQAVLLHRTRFPAADQRDVAQTE
jgi:hypothetical protein